MTAASRAGSAAPPWIAVVAAFLVALMLPAWRADATDPASADALPTEPDDDRPLVAFLGPLTGPNADIGQRAWRSVVLAFNQAENVRLERFDTEPDPVAAAARAIEAGAAALLGPIGELETRRVLDARAADAPPIFGLASSRGYEDAAAAAFRLRTSPADQAEALVAYVTEQQDQPPTFAVLYPDDPYGNEATDAFIGAASELGAAVLRAVPYPPDEPDVTDPVALLVGQTSQRLAPPGSPWQTPPRVRDLPAAGDRSRPDYLLIPEYAPLVAAILPHLRFQRWITDSHDTTVRLLGLSGWSSPGLSAVGDLAGGALFVSVFDADDLRGAAEAFALEYNVRFGDVPTEFDAQVFDAAAFVFAVVGAAGGQRDDIVDHAGRALVGGVCGNMSLSPAGGVLRPLAVWEVDGAGRRFVVGGIEPLRER